MHKSICFICGGLAGGGQERALTNLANEFARKGYRITIICLFNTEIFFEIHPSIKVIWPRIDRESTPKFIYAFKLIPFLRKNILLENPDTIISFGDWFNAYVIISTRFLKKPVFITNRMGPNLFLGEFLEFFNRLTYKNATALIVQTDTAKMIMKNKYGIKNIHTLANAVVPVNIPKLSHENSFITVGRLSKEKGHAVLIDAFSKLPFEDWRLDIIGDGPELENLRRQAADLGVDKRIFFHGKRKDFNDLLSNASFFVLPSFYEGFPNALVEAMSVPLVCIASDCVAGPGEIIQDGVNGFLFETGNSTELATIMTDLIKNKEALESIRLNAYEVRNKYNFHNISTEFLKIVTANNEIATN